MRKVIIGVQILIVVLVLIKVASFLDLLKKEDLFSGSTGISSQAIAQVKTTEIASDGNKTVTAVPEKSSQKNPMEDMLAGQRGLAEALAARKVELDNRENALRADEQRLMAMRKDITEKIAVLKAQEEKLAAQMDAAKEANIKRFKEMARVYEATPPAKAGPMMEKLDTKTAAGITMHMKKDKAGALWAYITPQKAVEITKEITRNGGYQSE